MDVILGLKKVFPYLSGTIDFVELAHVLNVLDDRRRAENVANVDRAGCIRRGDRHCGNNTVADGLEGLAGRNNGAGCHGVDGDVRGMLIDIFSENLDVLGPETVFLPAGGGQNDFLAAGGRSRSGTLRAGVRCRGFGLSASGQSKNHCKSEDQCKDFLHSVVLPSVFKRVLFRPLF